MSNKNADHYFLRGGGEMGALIRAKDWSKTSLGNPAVWPQSLRTIVAVMLDNPFGMYIAWGTEYTQIYNDGYRPILGTTKHPQALGISTRETFSEIWHIIEPMFDGVMNGTAVGYSDLMLPLNRNGFVEECYFDFAYSPIRKDNGEVGGVLVTVVETTNKKKTEEALKESEVRFRAIADDAPVFIFLAGENAEVEYLNKTWRDYTGISTNDSKGRAWAEITHIDDIDPATKIYMDGFNKRESCSFENRQKGIDGIYRTILWKATPRFSINGQFIGMMGVGFDINERKKSEEKLRESEQKVRELVENAPFPIAVYVGKEMIVELANQSIIDIWGKGEYVIGKSFKEVLPELDNQLVFEQIQKVFETGESFHTKNTPLDLIIDGKPYTYYFNYSFTPLYDINGNIYGVMNTGVDLTELNLAKKRIEESDKRFRDTMKQAPVGITILRGPQYIVEMANDVYLQLVDRQEAEFLGKPLFTSLPEVEETVRSLLDGVLNSGIPYHGNEVPVPINRNGKEEIFYFDFLYYPLKDEDGKITGVIVTVTEVTEKVETRKKIEENDAKLRSLIENAPFPIGVYAGKEMRVELANESIIKAWGKGNDVKGKLFKELVPEVKGQKIFEQLDAVFATGIPFHAHNQYIKIVIDGKEQPYYYNYSFTPVFDSSGKVYGVMNTASDVTEVNIAKKRIEESESNLKLMIHQAPVSIGILRGLDYTVEIVNKHALELWGRTEQEVLGKSIFTSMPELLTQGIKELLDDVINTGKRFATSEMPMQLMRNGLMETVYVNFSYEPLFNADQKVNGIMTVGMDVTQQVVARKKIEDSKTAIQESKEQLEFIIESAKGGSWDLDFLTGKVITSFRHDQCFGATEPIADWSYEKFLTYVHPEDRENEDRKFKTALANGSDWIIDCRVVWKDGSIHWIQSTGRNYRYKEGKPTRMLGMVREVTEQKEAQQIIKESEERFRTLAQSLPQLVWITDGNGNLEFGSNRWLAYTGIEPGSEGEWEKIIHPDDIQKINAEWNTCLNTGKTYSFDVRIRSKNGNYRWHTVIGEPIKNKENKIVKWVGAFTDIQDQKIREDKKDEFISIASHEMKTPLTTAKAYLHMLENILEQNNEKASLYAKKAKQSVNRLNELTSELLDVSKISFGKLNYTITNFNFNDMIESTVENLQLITPKHSIIKRGKVNDNVTGDQDRLQQVVINLLTNAIKYSPGADKVFVNIEQNNNNITVSVKDKGIGIAQHSLDKIFEKYHRVEEHSVHYQGLGIGLFISYEIIERHHGRLWAESEPGKGSTFYFTIPLHGKLA